MIEFLHKIGRNWRIRVVQKSKKFPYQGKFCGDFWPTLMYVNPENVQSDWTIIWQARNKSLPKSKCTTRFVHLSVCFNALNVTSNQDGWGRHIQSNHQNHSLSHNESTEKSLLKAGIYFYSPKRLRIKRSTFLMGISDKIKGFRLKNWSPLETLLSDIFNCFSQWFDQWLGRAIKTETISVLFQFPCGL